MATRVPHEVVWRLRARGGLAGTTGEVGGVGSVTVRLEGLSDARAALVRLLAVVESIRAAEERLQELVGAA
ncbi:MAG TPA: hypothetical protein VFH58_04510 [Acidimicrobiales bacterium]|nr:hypothetical protein [Acidimicrobiales bacterium]